MRILYIDIDSLRPDHLGCYGYHRDTSPHIDALARTGVRFENCYASDVPCLPSRTALWSGRFGYHTGVVDHGGIGADPFTDGPGRGFRDTFYATCWMSALRQAGFRTATVSPFGERHAAWHWYAGFNEIINPGRRGGEIAAEITPHALDWLQRNGHEDNWFLHVNYWDPHTAYRTPDEFGNPFENDPLPDWLTEEVRQRGWDGYGPLSPQEPLGYGTTAKEWQIAEKLPRIPDQLDSMAAVRRWIDGYDVGIRYADSHVGLLIEALADLGVLDDTVIMISADHGENQGELNVWGDHQTADHITCRIPLIVRWPGLDDTPRVHDSLIYHFDWAATLIELLGGQVPDNWDGRAFTEAFSSGRDEGREYLVVSQNAWACQRSVRFQDYLCMRTYHDGYKALDPLILFDLADDPHEQTNLAGLRPEVVARAMAHLADWEQHMALTSTHASDPLLTVLQAGGAHHTRGELPAYLERLRATGRAHHAEQLARLHPDEL